MLIIMLIKTTSRNSENKRMKLVAANLFAADSDTNRESAEVQSVTEAEERNGPKTAPKKYISLSLGLGPCTPKFW